MRAALAKLSERLRHVSLLDAVGADVALVERELTELVRSRVRIVDEVSRHTLDAGGKRLRPAFVLLAARAVGREVDEARARRLGACLELIHMATLIHDDVIDEAATRRGRQTAARIFGNTAGILSGDVLLARAMTVLADDGDLAIIRTVSRSVVEMAEGEAREVEVRGDFDLSEEHHLEVLRMKTASFVECCCRVGAMVGGGSEDEVEALAAYGHHLGMAFQIVDDLLDYRGEQRKTGKPMGTDFREGCATLPLIYVRDRLSAQEREAARKVFGTEICDEEVRALVAQMRRHGAFERAEAKAEEHIASALEALSRLADSDAKGLLEAATEYVLRRQQ